MSAFVVATVSIKDQEKFGEYAQKVPATLTEFNGEVVNRGKVAGVLAGTSDHQMIGILKFPNLDVLDRWYQSEEYQALVPLREEAAEMTLVKYAEPS